MGSVLFWIFFSVPAILFAFFYFSQKRRTSAVEEEAARLKKHVEALSRYEGVVDAEEKAREILDDAGFECERMKREASESIELTRLEIEEKRKQAADNLASIRADSESRIEMAKRQAQKIIEKAEAEAKKIAGEAYDVRENVKLYERALTAIKNTVEGYGNEYIVPSRNLLDDLAEEYGYTAAAQDLKDLRAKHHKMVKEMKTAVCDYAETVRRVTAVNFVTDAFNGKVDSILTRVKKDNFGKLRQEIMDAFVLVNMNGKAFRNARVTEEYRDSRVEELRLAVVLLEMKERDREEQRVIKERIREEEKARKEIERAIRDAQKEEELLQKAMEKIRGKYEQASEDQKAMYEQQLAEMEQRLKEAEEKNQRALSMAQQTKSGHVYIISNVGSFGDDVYKIGMTRRLEPLDRVRELGDASVPFAFDVHAMIWSEDAPALEASLHKTFALAQMNKVNYRKEFFRAPLQEIRSEIEKAGVIAKWTIAAEAREYRESLTIEKAIAESPEIKEAWLNKQWSIVNHVQTASLVSSGEDEEEEEAIA
jgi:hypothetical protein